MRRKTFCIAAVLLLTIAMSSMLLACGAKDPAVVKYTITFVGGDGAVGSAPVAVSAEAGDIVYLPANPLTKEGSAFVGWSDGAKTYTAGEAFTVPKQNVTFTAQWKAEDSGTDPDPDESTYITAAYKALDGVDAQIAFGENGFAMFTSDTDSLYCFFTYKITGNDIVALAEDLSEGGDPCGLVFPAAGTYENGALALNLRTKTKTYRFGLVQHAISFDAGGGSLLVGADDSPVFCVEGESYVLPQNTLFERAGYTFDGWRYNGRKYAAGDTFTMLASDVTFTAQWEPIADVQACTVTFTAGDFADVTGADFTVNAQTYEQIKLPRNHREVPNPDDPATPLIETIFTRDGFGFGGWLINGKVYAPGTTYEVVADVTATVQWTKKVTVSFDNVKNVNNSRLVEPQELSSGLKQYLPDNKGMYPLKQEGFLLVGWTGGGKTYLPGDSYIVPETDITFTAVWEKLRYINFMPNGGTGAQRDPIEAVAGQEITLPFCPYKKTGYRFDGWSYNGTIYHAGDTFIMPAITNINFLATWTEGEETGYTDIKQLANLRFTGNTIDTGNYGVYTGFRVQIDPNGNAELVLLGTNPQTVELTVSVNDPLCVSFRISLTTYEITFARDGKTATAKIYKNNVQQGNALVFTSPLADR